MATTICDVTERKKTRTSIATGGRAGNYNRGGSTSKTREFYGTGLLSGSKAEGGGIRGLNSRRGGGLTSRWLAGVIWAVGMEIGDFLPLGGVQYYKNVR